MTITITHIRLRRWWHYFKLTYNAMHIVRQTQHEKGFIKMKSRGWGLLHYTISAWESEADLKRFAHSGAHLEVMKQSRNISTEVGIYTYSNNTFPDWKTAKRLIREHGKIFSFS